MDLTVDLYICGIYNNIVVKYDFMFLGHLSWAKRETGKSLCGPATVSSIYIAFIDKVSHWSVREGSYV